MGTIWLPGGGGGGEGSDECTLTVTGCSPWPESNYERFR